mmetsp:Transcript_19182/g.43865  ORF Transcript_19182/g.43865 Transcript_19182/m.43865 type:complete len:108 (-) Transcript_19182:1704-2027(-)
MSYETSEETAIDSADPVDTMAMKSMIKMRTAPGSPSKCEATAGGTNPDPASFAVMGSINAVEVKPREVARENGMANQQILSLHRKYGENSSSKRNSQNCTKEYGRKY